MHVFLLMRRCGRRAQGQPHWNKLRCRVLWARIGKGRSVKGEGHFHVFFFCHLFTFISWSSMDRNEHLHVGCWVVWPVHTCTILYFSNCPFIQSLVSTVVFDWGNLESQTSHVFLSGCLAFGVAARRPVGIAGVNQKFLRYRALSVNDNDTDQSGL